MNLGRRVQRFLGIAGLSVTLGVLSTAAQAGLFKSGWVLNNDQSSLSYEVVQNKATTETHRFSGLEGSIGADGATIVSIDLASIETNDDLRDTRMRYVLFESFKFPKAVISSKLDERLLAGFDILKIYNLDLKVTLELHGVRREVAAEVVATMLDDETVSIESVEPVFIRARDFGFSAGIEQLEQAYFGEAAPYAAVSFKFVFDALSHVETPVAVAEAAEVRAPEIVNGRSTAVEATDVCLDRLKALRPARSLYFRNASYQLASDSLVVLADVAGAIRPCDTLKISVEGHTDDVGDEVSNQLLSQRRANHVTNYLLRLGLPKARVSGEGFGELRPIVPNDTAENRSKNRRIEFSIQEG